MDMMLFKYCDGNVFPSLFYLIYNNHMLQALAIQYLRGYVGKPKSAWVGFLILNIYI